MECFQADDNDGEPCCNPCGGPRISAMGPASRVRMFRHYLTVAVRSFRRGPLAACVNILTLALGLTALVIAYGVVSYWERSERAFANPDRTYAVPATFQARDGGRATPLPMTNRLYADYLRADF